MRIILAALNLTATTFSTDSAESMMEADSFVLNHYDFDTILLKYVRSIQKTR